MQPSFQPTVSVTGATGFLGRHLIRSLLANGYKVKALARTHHYLRRESASVNWVRGSLDHYPTLAELVSGADFVIHLAGSVRGASYEDFACANVTGCSYLIEAIKQMAPEAKCLLVSSLAARHPELSHYACSKRSGEILLQASNINWTIFRPTAAYGPDDRELLPLFRLMTQGLAPIMGTQDARISLLYVKDFVSATLAWLIHWQQAMSKIYELSDSHPNAYGWQEISDIVVQVAGKRQGLPLPVPAAVLLAVSRANCFFSRCFGYPPMLTPGKVNEILHPDWRCDLTAADLDLGWTPAYSLADGLKAMSNWC